MQVAELSFDLELRFDLGAAGCSGFGFGFELRFGPSIWNIDLERRFGASIWNIDLEHRFGASIWSFDLELRFGTLELGFELGAAGRAGFGFGIRFGSHRSH